MSKRSKVEKLFDKEKIEQRRAVYISSNSNANKIRKELYYDEMEALIPKDTPIFKKIPKK